MAQLESPAPLEEGISREYLMWHRVCPIGRTAEGRLRVAVAPGANRDGVRELGYAYDAEPEEVDIDEAEFNRLVDDLTLRGAGALELAPVADDTDLMSDVRNLASQPPVVRYVNLLIRDAFEAKASDVHLEATREGLVARFRLDGVLAPATEPPPAIQQAVISRIKLLAELDIAERRRPQDGRIRVRLESRELDLRVATVPTMHGESVVLRLLDRGGRPVGLDELGMHSETLSRVMSIARKPHGMLIVTGPTGSGKTTTLYAALQSRDLGLEKVITVEDPIEYQLDAVTQVPVNRAAGVNFASALRALLRQDPDVIMIGEMRDAETAEIAVQASMTGHFVFSTLHTNDAISAIPRLVDLGVPEYLISATVEAVLAQRLVRRICDACRVSYTPPSESIAALLGRPVAPRSFTRGAGCRMCRGTGFAGRLGLYELVQIDDGLRDAITKRLGRGGLKSAAADAGMTTLRADGWRKVEQGLTTVEEVLRVTQA